MIYMFELSKEQRELLQQWETAVRAAEAARIQLEQADAFADNMRTAFISSLPLEKEKPR